MRTKNPRNRNGFSDGPWALLFAMPAIVVMTFGLGGCETTTAPPPARATKAITDPSAERLHELSGALLLYYLRERELPPSLPALRQWDPSAPAGIDPLYGEPYVYLSPPVALRERRGQLLMYAPGVARGQRAARWAVLVEGVGQAGALNTQVVLLPSEEIAKAVEGRK